MGKRNRDRRRNKAKNHFAVAAGAADEGDRFASSSIYDGLALDKAFALFVQAHAVTDHGAGSLDRSDALLARLLSAWATPAPSGSPSVPETVAAALASGLSAAWERGWQPADLVHAMARKRTAWQRGLLVDAIAADAESWRHHPDADPLWLAHLDELGARRWWPAGTSLLDAAVGRERRNRADVLLAVATLVDSLWRVPRLPPVGDPPSAWGRPRRPRHSGAGSDAHRQASAGIDARILHRVHALLAKAESTEFPAEAESLTVKAQELMARYSIDRAMVTAGGSGSGRGEEPVARRILLHDPYAKGKSLLLSEVATACRCSAVGSKHFGFSTVFGFPVDVDVVEILYTSLVMQCSAALQAASRNVVNPRSYRDSFTIAFAARIGGRLAEAAAAAIEDRRRHHGDSLLPVLASRAADVEAALDDAFPDLVRRRVRAGDPRGWVAGTAAAEVANLSVGKAVAG